MTWRATRGELPGWARPALALWLGALLASWWPPLIVLGIVAAVLLAVGKIHGRLSARASSSCPAAAPDEGPTAGSGWTGKSGQDPSSAAESTQPTGSARASAASGPQLPGG